MLEYGSLECAMLPTMAEDISFTNLISKLDGCRNPTKLIYTLIFIIGL